MDKLIQLGAYTEEGEPRVQIIDPFSTVKTASDALNYAKSIAPCPGYTYVLVLAMSAGEFYGPNRNGDAFAESPIPGIVEPGQTLRDHYKRFETGATVFEHHKNKDPSKGMGTVVKAFYNDRMHRVELLLKLDNNKAANVVQKINNCEFPAVSMGCRIKYDVCSRRGCHNKAKTRRDYCQHAAMAMNKVDDSTGEQNFVWNPDPDLFDISFVLRPADKIGFTMKKVARYQPSYMSASSALLHDQTAFLKSAAAEFGKLAEMDKYVRGDTAYHTKGKDDMRTTILPRIMDNMQLIPSPTCGLLSSFGFPDLLSSLGSMGIHLTAHEASPVISARLGMSDSAGQQLQKMSPLMSSSGINLFRFFPELIHAFTDTPWSPTPNKIRITIVRVARPLMEKRSSAEGYLYRHAITPLTSAEDPSTRGVGLHHLVRFRSGNDIYQTTRQSVEQAQDAALSHNVKAGVGSAVGALGLYKLLTLSPVGRALFPLALAGSALGGKAVYDRVKVRDIGGTDLPVNTELSKLSSAHSELKSVVILANEYNTPSSDGYQSKLAVAQSLLHNAVPTDDASAFVHKLAMGIDPRNQGHAIDNLIKEAGLEGFPLSTDVNPNAFSQIHEYLGQGLTKLVV